MEQQKKPFKLRKIILVILPVFIALAVLTLLFSVERNIKPERVLVTNLTDTGATVTWYTEDETESIVYYKKKDGKTWSSFPVITTMGKEKAHDDRDIDQNEDGEWELKDEGSTKRHTHHVTLRNLEPETTYEFRIGGNYKTVNKDNNDNQLTPFKTKEIIDDISTPNPAYGKVEGLEENGDSLIKAYLTASDNTSLIYTGMISTALNSNGTYSFEINYLTNQLELEEADNYDNYRIYIEIIDSQNKVSYKTFELKQYKPLDTIVINHADNNAFVSKQIFSKYHLIPEAKAQSQMGCTNANPVQCLCPDSNVYGCISWDNWSRFATELGGSCVNARNAGILQCPGSTSDQDNNSQDEPQTPTKLAGGSNCTGNSQCASGNCVACDNQQVSKCSDANWQQPDSLVKATYCPKQDTTTNQEADTTDSGIVQEDAVGSIVLDTVNGECPTIDGLTSIRCNNCGPCVKRQFFNDNGIQACTEACKLIENIDKTYTPNGDSVRNKPEVAETSSQQGNTNEFQYYVGTTSDAQEAFNTASMTVAKEFDKEELDIEPRLISCKSMNSLYTEICNRLNGAWCLADRTNLGIVCNVDEWEPSIPLFIHEITHLYTDYSTVDTNKVPCINTINELASEIVSGGGGLYTFTYKGTSYSGAEIENIVVKIAEETGMSYEDVKKAIRGEDNETLYRINAEIGLCNTGGLNYAINEKENSANPIANRLVRSVKAQENNNSGPVTNDTIILSADDIDAIEGEPTELEPGKYVLYSDVYEITTSKLVVKESDQKVKMIYFNDLNKDGKKQKDEPEMSAPTLVEISKEAEAYTYNFNYSWNLFSFPFFSEDITKASTLMKYLNDNSIDALNISNFENNSFSSFTYRENDETYSNDFSIIPGKGYFIKTANSGEITFTGNQYKENAGISANQGWNLIGISNSSDQDAEKLINTCEEKGYKIDRVSRYNSGIYETVVKEDSLLYGNNFNLINKAGYFVRVSQTQEPYECRID